MYSFKENDKLANPFKEGKVNPKIIILANLLPNKPLTKEEIIHDIPGYTPNRTKGYLSNDFALLRKSGILKFVAHKKTWEQGENYLEYMGYLFVKLLQQDNDVLESFKHLLLPDNESKAVDFINAPENDVFNKPNPFI